MTPLRRCSQLRIAVTMCGLWSCGAEPGATAPVSSIAQEATAGDELGMARHLGPTTWARCAPELANARAKVYELFHPRSGTMPLSPFGGPYAPTYLPSAGLPAVAQLYNMEVLNADANPGQQGTQMDAFGHFAHLDEAWDGTSELPADRAQYYGGLTQAEVKPTPDSPLLRLGMDKIPPVVTTAVLLDARTHVGGGEPMAAGEHVTAQHLEEMLRVQGLEERGILPGDIVLVYTGWSDHYRDPDTEGIYYSMAPGLSIEAAQYLGEQRVVAVGLDQPFVDAVADGQLAGTAGPPAGTPQGMAFPVHDHFLTQVGVYTLENLRLKELADDQVWTSCAIVLPLLTKGGAGSAVRPVAFGMPGQ